MEISALDKILAGLYEKTSQNQVLWTKTSSQNEYKTRLGKSSITIDNWVNPVGENCADLGIYNSDGILVDRVVVSENDNPEYYRILLNLLTLISNRFNKVEETYKDIFDALNS